MERKIYNNLGANIDLGKSVENLSWACLPTEEFIHYAAVISGLY